MTVDYDNQAQKWVRDRPSPLSDVIARPIVFDFFKKYGIGGTILDLGCGEGYFSRLMAPLAGKVIGIDNSKEMIKQAIEKENKQNLGIDYILSDVRDLSFIKDKSIDMCVGNFITNYLKPDELQDFYRNVSRVLREKGRFIFLMPHPKHYYQMLNNGDRKSAWLDKEQNFDYEKSRGEFFLSHLKTLNGNIFDVGNYHSLVCEHNWWICSQNLFLDEHIEIDVPEDVCKQYPLFDDMKGETVYMILRGRNVPI